MQYYVPADMESGILIPVTEEEYNAWVKCWNVTIPKISQSNDELIVTSVQGEKTKLIPDATDNEYLDAFMDLYLNPLKTIFPNYKTHSNE